MKYFLYCFLFLSAFSLKAEYDQIYAKKLKADLTQIITSENPEHELYQYVMSHKDELREHKVVKSSSVEGAVKNLVSSIVAPVFVLSPKVFGYDPKWNSRKKCYNASNSLARPLTEITGLRYYQPNGWHIIGHPQTVTNEDPQYFNFERDTDYPFRDDEMWRRIPDADYNLLNQMMRFYGDARKHPSCAYGDLDCFMALPMPKSFVELGFTSEEQVKKVSSTLSLGRRDSTFAKVYSSLREVFLKAEKEKKRGKLHILKEQLLNLFSNSLCP